MNYLMRHKYVHPPYPQRFRPRLFSELKFIDTEIETFNDGLPLGLIISNLHVIAEGTGDNERVGGLINVKSFTLKYLYVHVGAVIGLTIDDAGQIFRFIVFIDKQTNGQSALVTDVLQTADYRSFLNMANSDRFDILEDKSVTLNPQGWQSNSFTADTVTTPNRPLQGNFYKQFTLPIFFDGVTGATTEIRDNSINLLLISRTDGSELSSATTTEFTATVRLRFHDGL